MPKPKSGFYFERDIINSAAFLGAHVHKIPNTLFGSFGRRGIYDILALYNGVYVGIECKVISSALSFPFGRVEPQQVSALEEVQKCGGRGVILINVRVPRKQDAYIVPINDFLHLRSTLDRKSIPNTIIKSFDKLDRIKIGTSNGWDVSKLFK